MSYATPADLAARFGEEEMIRLSSPDLSAVDDAKLQSALDDASAEIDSYIANWLPLKADVPRLRLVAMELARWQLYSLSSWGATEDVNNRYKAQVRWLEMVATGKVQLGADDAGVTAEPTEGPEVISPDRLFSRAKLRRL